MNIRFTFLPNPEDAIRIIKHTETDIKQKHN